MDAIEVFIIEDHPFYIEGVRKTFSKSVDKIFVGGWAESVPEAREKLKCSQADIVFLDLILPGESGVVFCHELKKDYPNMKIIALTGETDANILYNVWMNGVDAIITKATGKKQMINTIHQVLKGQRILGQNLPPFFDNHTKTRNTPFLTKRENQVMNLLVGAYSRKEVAEKLNITIDTVGKHCNNVYDKFGVDSLPKFMQKARKLKIIN